MRDGCAAEGIYLPASWPPHHAAMRDGCAAEGSYLPASRPPHRAAMRDGCEAEIYLPASRPPHGQEHEGGNAGHDEQICWVAATQGCIENMTLSARSAGREGHPSIITGISFVG